MRGEVRRRFYGAQKGLVYFPSVLNGSVVSRPAFRNSRGFSLTELLIALLIVGVLAGFAAPNYTQFLIRGKLVEAPSALPELAAELEKVYLDNRTYSVDGNSCDITLPVDQDAKYFTYNCTPQNEGQRYLLTATSRGESGLGEPGGYVYTLNESGVRRTVAYAGQTLSDANCWLLADESC